MVTSDQKSTERQNTRLLVAFAPEYWSKTTNKWFLKNLEVHNTSLVNPERRNDPEVVTTGVERIASGQKGPKGGKSTQREFCSISRNRHRPSARVAKQQIPPSEFGVLFWHSWGARAMAISGESPPLDVISPILSQFWRCFAGVPLDEMCSTMHLCISGLLRARLTLQIR